MRRRRNLLAAIAPALALIAMLAPAAAQAHAVLERTVPERGADLRQQPAQVAFFFNEPVESEFGSVRVFDSSGEEVQSGSVLRPGGRPDAVAVALEPDLPDGSYTATYRVISADGHVETPPVWTKYVPEKWQDRAPRLIPLPDGGEGWLIEGQPLLRNGQNITGRGPIRQLLETVGAWTDEWRVPACDPVQYLAEVGYLRPGVIVVHAVHLTDQGLERLRHAGAVVVTCPRSNEWVGAGPPRLAHFYASGVPIAVGTDSLASAPSLNLFEELSEMRRIAPEVTAASLLESATRIGARALGFGREYGTLAAGKRAAIISVEVPRGIDDVEEYLVGDVPAASVRPVTV